MKKILLIYVKSRLTKLKITKLFYGKNSGFVSPKKWNTFVPALERCPSG